MKVWVEPHTTVDKNFQIILGNDAGLILSVDYDDVDHETVDKMVDKLVSLIKTHWTEEE